jgi:transposase-like protein
MERGREVWEPRVRRLRESDLTVAEFAAELGVNPKTLTYWKWRLGKEASEGKATSVAPVRARRAPRFVEVEPESTTPSSTAERIEVVLDGGLVLRVPHEFEPATLRRVVAALTSPLP